MKPLPLPSKPKRQSPVPAFVPHGCATANCGKPLRKSSIYKIRVDESFILARFRGEWTHSGAAVLDHHQNEYFVTTKDIFIATIDESKSYMGHRVESLANALDGSSIMVPHI